MQTEIKEGDPDFKLERSNQFLTIKNIGVSKGGRYKCKAKNSEGDDEAIGTVQVAGKYER